MANGSFRKALRDKRISFLSIVTNRLKACTVKSEITAKSSLTEPPNLAIASTTLGLIDSNSGITR